MTQPTDPERNGPADASSSGAADEPSTGTTDATATEQFPVPPPAARRSEPARRSDPPPRAAPTVEQERPADTRDDEQDHAATVLDQPVDNVDLATRLRRPGLARSTRILLLVLGGIVCLALGAFVGRATAPDTGPGSVPDLLGVVESVQPTGGGFPIVTVRSGDGTQTALRTTAGTSVAVPRPDGPAGLRVGQQVTVHAERGTDGAITAVRVDVPAGP